MNHRSSGGNIVEERERAEKYFNSFFIRLINIGLGAMLHLLLYTPYLYKLLLWVYNR